MAATAATTGGPTNVLRLGCQRQRLHGHEKGRHLYTCMGVPGDGHEAQLGTKASAPFAPGVDLPPGGITALWKPQLF